MERITTTPTNNQARFRGMQCFKLSPLIPAGILRDTRGKGFAPGAKRFSKNNAWNNRLKSA